MTDSRPPRIPRVLLVEDDEFVQRVFARHLRKRAAFTVVESAAGARALFAEHAYDIVVCDMQLPDGSGIALLAEAADAYPSAKLVLCSGSAPKPASLAPVAGGRVPLFMHKPEGLEELVELVRQWSEEGA
jgi:DNA-binding NtrC family response regulator